MSPQQYNAQLIEQLATDFPRRKEPNYAWGNAVSGLLLTPRLRGLWTSSADEGYNCYDLSGQVRTLTPSVSPPNATQAGITPLTDFIAANTQYYTRPTEPGLVITSNLTIWSWVYCHAPSTGASVAFLGKYGAAGQRGYLLYKPATDDFYFSISSDGTVVTSVVEAAPLYYTVNKWFFVCGRYTPSTEMKLWVGNPVTGKLKTVTNVAAIPAAIHPSTQAFEVSRANAANYFDGYQSLWGLSAFPVNDTAIFNIFHQTRPLFM